MTDKRLPWSGNKGRALKQTLGLTGEWMDNLRDTSCGVGGAAGCAILSLRYGKSCGQVRMAQLVSVAS